MDIFKNVDFLKNQGLEMDILTSKIVHLYISYENVDISNLEQDKNVDILYRKKCISKSGKYETPGRYRVLRPVFLLF